MSMTTENKPCRSVSPDDDACTKPRGHKGQWHQGQVAGKASKTKRWRDGVNKPPQWEYIDDGYRTEADYIVERMIFGGRY